MYGIRLITAIGNGDHRSKQVKYVQVVVLKKIFRLITSNNRLELRNYPEDIVNAEFVKNKEQVEGKYNMREQSRNALLRSDIGRERPQ